MDPLSEVQSAVAAAIQRLNDRPQEVSAAVRPLNNEIFPKALHSRPYLDAIFHAIPQLWDVLWSHRGIWDDAFEISRASALAENYVNTCSYLPGPGYPAWGSSRLPHLLVFCAVKLREAASRGRGYSQFSNFVGCVYRLAIFPNRSCSTAEMRMFTEEMAQEIDPPALVQTILDAVDDPIHVDMDLFMIMSTAASFMACKRLLSFFLTARTLDVFGSAVARNRKHSSTSKEYQAKILHMQAHLIVKFFDTPPHSHVLLTGIYDLFGPVAEGLTCQADLASEAHSDPGLSIAAYGCLIRQFEAIIVEAKDPDVSRNRDLVPGLLDKLIPGLREKARKDMPRLLMVVQAASIATRDAEAESWRTLLNHLVSFSIAAGVHPFCAAPTCDYHLRSMPGGEKFRKCGGCMDVMYCSTECQKVHRKAHKEKCGRMLKA